MTSLGVSKHNIITLTTDFGCKDPFVGEMKGVILTINPHVNIVDITHGIESHNIEEGAFVIGSSYKYFPSGTIHIAVVDPSVGSERMPVILKADGHYFIGPDNGIFSYIMAYDKKIEAVSITNAQYLLSKDSPTFQGRDVFAPAAAWLSKGVAIEEFGTALTDLKRFRVPMPSIEDNFILGEVIYIDRFGNAIANIKRSDMKGIRAHYAALNDIEASFVGHYSEAKDSGLHCLFNSSGHLEFFVYAKSASALFNIKKGDKTVIAA